jgi:uncharacterized protein (TIGR00369 family)
MSQSHVPPVDELTTTTALPDFFQYLGLTVVEVSTEHAVVRMDAPKGLLSPYGPVHGGAIAALIDTAIGAAVAAHLPAGDRTATHQLNLNFISFARSPVVIATARVLRLGQTVAHTEAEARAEDGTLVATALGTFGILRKRTAVRT